MLIAAIVLASICAGCAVYCGITVVAAWDYLRSRRPGKLGTVTPFLGHKSLSFEETPIEKRGGCPQVSLPGISVLKPLAGAEDDLASNLRTFFEQDYPEFEILFAVRDAADPAVSVVQRLQVEFPAVPTKLILTGEPPYPNAKVWSLDHMMRAARYDLLAMSDSDTRVTPDFLATAAAEFADPQVGLATCPYRAVPGASLWTTVEAIGMNTQFLGGVLAARLLEGMKFALGPTILARKPVLAQMGGFDRLKDYLAEDFVMGKLAAELGHRVVLSAYVIEHHIGSAGLRQNFGHRLRWSRSTRRSRPAGYAGELFTMPLPWLLALWLVEPRWWPGAVGLAALRVLSAWACAGWVLHDRLTLRRWYLLPIQDLLAFGFWVAGFFGNTIHWRGRSYFLKPDGTFELIRR